MDISLLALVVVLLILAGGLDFFIGAEIAGLARSILSQIVPPGSSTFGLQSSAPNRDIEQRTIIPYRDRKTVQRLIDHFEEEEN